MVELKTVIAVANRLAAGIDRKLRLGGRIARERGWEPRTISAGVVVVDTRSNRRRLAAHRAMLRPAFPQDGHAMRRWLADPTGVVRALSFLSLANGSSVSRHHAGVKRVRKAVGEAFGTVPDRAA